MLSSVNCFLSSILQNREALISSQCESVYPTAQKLEIALCKRSYTLMVWEGVLEIMGP